MADGLSIPEAHEAVAANFDFQTSLAEFSDACAEKFPDRDRIEEAGAAELYLAAACQRGDARAIAHFESAYLAVVKPAIAHMGLGVDGLDEVRQHVREKLLIPTDDGSIRLLGYAGDGTLGALVKVMAVRAGLSILRKRKPEAPADELDALPAAENDPELSFLKRQYRAEFKQAFATAAGELTSKQRNLLRMHLLHGVTLQGLADSYGVHRATVVRWLADARSALLKGTQRAMRDSLRATRSELESVMGLIESHLDASVHRLLDSD